MLITTYRKQTPKWIVLLQKTTDALLLKNFPSILNLMAQKSLLLVLVLHDI